jgi:hypothetical protein
MLVEKKLEKVKAPAGRYAGQILFVYNQHIAPLGLKPPQFAYFLPIYHLYEVQNDIKFE